MKRRKFALSASTILGGIGYGSLRKPVAGLEFQISPVTSVDPSRVDALSVNFNKFEITPKYLDQSLDLRITVEVILIGRSIKKNSDVSFVNGETLDSSDIWGKTNYSIPIDGIDTSKSSLSGEIKITLSNGSIFEEMYKDTFSISNDSSILDIFGPDTVTTNEQFTLDSNVSADLGNNSLTYQWDFGDGTQASGKSVNHTYNNQGDYNIMLTVTDDTGISYTKSTNIFANETPSADFTFSPSDPDPNESVSFDATQSNDSGGTIEHYDWEFGDGNEGSGETVTHTYSDSGNYSVTLTVTDDKGAIETRSLDVSVQSFDGVIDNFESGNSWNDNNGSLSIRSSRSYEGSKSGEVSVNNQDNIFTAASQQISIPEKKPNKVRFYYYETSGNNSGGLGLYDGSGDLIIGAGTENPQLCYTNGGNRTVFDGGSGYNEWMQVTYDFDWSSGNVDIEFYETSNNVSTTTENVSLGSNNGIEEIRVGTMEGRNDTTRSFYIDKIEVV